jgi:uncharacterized protein YraI
MKLPGFLIAALLLTAPTAALAARGIVTEPVSMRAGPGIGFPVVDRIPGGARVNIHGCVRGDAWCDVSWDGDRGWVSAEYLEYFYRNRYVYLPDYVDVVDVPVVPFVLGSYWASYYAGRPFYHRRAYWNNYWQSHARFATRLPTGRLPGAAVQARGSEAAFANERGERALRGRMDSGRLAHVNERRGEFAGTRQAVVGARGSSAAPINGRVAHPYAGRVAGAPPPAHARVAAPAAMGRPMPFAAPHGGPAVAGRVGGPPLQAHAQAAAPRPMGSMPHAAPGGAPHIAAPPSGGGRPMGGPPPGGGHGRPH